MTYKRTKIRVKRARKLRSRMTDAERHLWRAVRTRQLGVKFRRQEPVGRFVVDFLSHEAKLIVEIDGGQHTEQTSADNLRTAFLETKGFEVVRFWNNEVFENLEGVLMVIDKKIKQGPPPDLPPRAVGGTGKGKTLPQAVGVKLPRKGGRDR